MSQNEKRKRGRPPAPDAQYRRIAAALRAEVTSGALAPGASLSSLRALATKYGVSYRTIWQAINALKEEGALAAGPGRKISVLPPGESSASVRSPLLEVVSYSKLGPALENPIGWALHLGVGLGADEIDASVFTVHGMSLRSSLPDGFGELAPRGVLLLGHFDESALRSYARTGLPAVLVDWPAPSWPGHAIYADNDAATRDAAERLLAMGHRDIAFMQRVSLRQKDLDLDAKERARSLRKALKAAGVPQRRESVFTVPHREDESGPAIARLLAARPAFTAVMASDGELAAMVIAAARAAGKDVPREISVIGFQPADTPDHPDMSGPRIDFEAMGREAVHLVRESVSAPRQVRFPAVWYEGDSTDRCREPRGGTRP